MSRTTQSRRAAIRLLSDVRKAGGLVLLVDDRLQLLNAHAVPTQVRFRLLELERFVTNYLRGTR